MRGKLGTVLAVTVFLAACQAPSNPVAKRSVPKAGEASQAPAASIKPSLSPSATPATAVLRRLQRPDTPTSVLAGTIAIDASYVVAGGAGNIVAGGGGNAVILGDARIVANDGATVVAGGSGNVVAAGAGNLVANDGGTLIGQDGSSIVAAGGGNYRLAAEGEAPVVGTVLPAVGMAISVRSLLTGELLPVGVDADGTRVYSVYSNAEGAYEIYVPEEAADNVLVEARAPGNADLRLHYGLIVPVAEAASQPLDEDTALVARYIEEGFIARLKTILSEPFEGNNEEVIGKWLSVSDDLRAQFIAQMKELNKAGEAAGLYTATEADKFAVARAATRVALAHINLTEIPLLERSPDEGDAARSAVSVLIEILKYYREQAAMRMKAEPDFFAHTDFIIAANACKSPADQIVIRRPSDLGDLWLNEYIVKIDNTVFNWVGNTMEPLGTRFGPTAGNVPPKLKINQSERLNAACASFAIALSQKLFAEPETKALALQSIARYKPGLATGQTTLRPSPCPQPSFVTPHDD